MNWGSNESNTFPACRPLVSINAQHFKHLYGKMHRSCRKLLVWNFPHLRSDFNDTLELVRYHQLRNDCAYRCHRQRRLAELATWATLAPQPPG